MALNATSAHLAVLVAGLGILSVVVGVTGAHFQILPPFVGFRLFAAGLVLGGVLGLVLGLVGLARGGGTLAWLGTTGGVALALTLGLLAAPAGRYPAIHDLTTNPDDPPVFSEAAKHPDNVDRDLTYPHGGERVTAQQREAYPDLEPIALDLPADEAFRLARETADALGWKVLWANAELGLIEAYDESELFHFVDDVAVRVRAAADGSVVDVRSTSRVGVSDLGVNAARIRRFAERLRAAADRDSASS